MLLAGAKALGMQPLGLFGQPCRMRHLASSRRQKDQEAMEDNEPWESTLSTLLSSVNDPVLRYWPFNGLLDIGIEEVSQIGRSAILAHMAMTYSG